MLITSAYFTEVMAQIDPVQVKDHVTMPVTDKILFGKIYIYLKIYRITTDSLVNF